MNSIPLAKTNNINDINTSIIAIKKQLKELEEALGLIDGNIPDVSPFVKKSDIVDTVTSGNMNPVTSNAVANYTVDTVASGNMHSVSSNAVAEKFKVVETTDIGNFNFYNKSVKKVDKTVYLDLELFVAMQTLPTNTTTTIATLPEGFRPKTRMAFPINNIGNVNTELYEVWTCLIDTSGNVSIHTGNMGLTFCFVHTTFLVA